MSQSRSVRADLDPAVELVLRRSFLAQLPTELRAELLAQSTLQGVAAGRLLSRVGDPLVHGLVVSGLLRTYAVLPKGHQLNLLYARAGRWLGAPDLEEGPFPCAKEAVIDARVLRFPAKLVEHLAMRHAPFAWAIARELTMSLYHLYDAAARHVLAPLADRVAYQLLESAFAARSDRDLVSPLRQQDLANAVGSPRESVARIVKRLRDNGSVVVTRRGVRIVRPERLGVHRERVAWAGRWVPSSTGLRTTAATPFAEATEDFGAALKSAIAASPLGPVPESTRHHLLERGLRLDIPARSLLYRAGGPPVNGLLVSGLARSYAIGRDGRQFTVLYSRPGRWLGLPTVPGGPFPLNVEAMTDVIALELPEALVEDVALTQPQLAWSVAKEIARRLWCGFDVLTEYAFATVGERLACRLLELTMARPTPRELVAPLSVGDLANSIGATTSSTSRALAKLRAAGAVRTEPSGVRVLRPELLAPTRWGGRAGAGAG